LDFEQLLQSLPPEVASRLLEMSIMGERGGLLQQQMEAAQALGQPSGQQYSTGMGAGLGGLGDVIRAGASAFKQRDLRGQQEALLQEKLAGRKTFANVLRQPGVDPSTVPDVSEPQMLDPKMMARGGYDYGSGTSRIAGGPYGSNMDTGPSLPPPPQPQPKPKLPLQSGRPGANITGRTLADILRMPTEELH